MRVLHQVTSPGVTSNRDAPSLEAAKGVGRFGFHFMEMCAVMCLGGGLLVAAFFGVAAALGMPDLRQQHPELSAFAIACILAAAMAAWMRFRAMGWRPTLEMAGSSVVSGLVLILAYWQGIISARALLPAVCALACVAMLAVMLVRIPLYASSHGGHRTRGG